MEARANARRLESLQSASILVDAELVLHPRKHLGTLETGVDVAVALQLARLELTQVRVVAGHQARVDFALALPRVEVVDLAQLRGRAHPLDRLVVGHEPHVLLLDHLVDEAQQRAQVALLLEPDGVEVEPERRLVRGVVALEVVLQHVVHLVLGQVGGAGVDHRAGVALDLERVHDHLPHAGEGARRALLARARALVRDAVVHGEGPQRVGVGLADLAGRHHGGVVEEAELLHHDHLRVPAHAQEGHAHAAQVVERDAGELVDDVGHAGELVEPVLHGGVEGPPQLGLLVRDRVDGDLVAVVPQLLHVAVVGVLVRQEEGALDGTAVRVRAVRGEDFRVDLPVLVVDGVVQRDDDHLRRLVHLDVAGDSRAVGAAEAVGQRAVGQVTPLGRVRVVLRVAVGLVRVVETVDLAVAEELLVQTFLIGAGQLARGTDGLVRDEQRPWRRAVCSRGASGWDKRAD